jgi:hypothetical protein
MGSAVRLTILWEDGGMMAEEFPSKAEAVDWLAENETDRSISTVVINPVDEDEP